MDVPPGDGPPVKKSRGPYKGYLNISSGKSVPDSTRRSRIAAQEKRKHAREEDNNVEDLRPSHLQSAPRPGSHDVSLEGEETLQSPAISDDEDDDDDDVRNEDTPNNCGEGELSFEDVQSVELHQDQPCDDRAAKLGVNYVQKYKLEECLYQGISTTRFDVLVMILHMALRHCHTQHFIEDQIKFVNAIFGDNVLDISFYIFQKIFNASARIERHFFCPDCEMYVGCGKDFKDMVAETLPKCPSCDREINVQSVDSGNYFVTLSLKDQIELILKRPEVKLVPPEKRQSNGNVISDVFDGEIYRKCSEPGGPLADGKALTVTFNTDGASVFSSCKNTLWPILLYINEIVPEQRLKTENVILGGLWFGKSAPLMSMFLKPFCEELSSVSVSYQQPDGSVVQNVPVFPLACSCDSVAKPKVTCMKQFNAFMSCLYCYHPNDSVVGAFNPKYPQKRYFDTSVTHPLRTECEVIKDMFEADLKVRQGVLGESSVNGFLGLSVFLMFTSILDKFPSSTFNMIWSVVIDYMHAILEGIGPNLLDLFEDILSDENKKKLNDRLTKITPPQIMNRKPRSISERIHWKAKEYRSLLLYYILPIVEDMLSKRNFLNLKQLVQALHILLSDSVSLADLRMTRTLLSSFVSGFQSLYGPNKVTYNLHLLTHLVDLVLKLGPLWCYSNFVFESFNGILLKLIRGTRSVVNEIAVKFTMLQTASKHIAENPVSEKALEFCENVLGFKYYVKNSEQFHNVTVLGGQSVGSVDDQEYVMLSQSNVFVTNHQVRFYNRAIREGIVYSSRSYSRSKVFNDSCIILGNGNYACIDKIVESQNRELLCLVKPIRIAQNIIPSIKRCAFNLHARSCIVPFSQIIKKCVLVSFEDKNFVCDIPNYFERD